MLIYFCHTLDVAEGIKPIKVHVHLGFHSISAFLNSSGQAGFTGFDLVIFSDKDQ